MKVFRACAGLVAIETFQVMVCDCVRECDKEDNQLMVIRRFSVVYIHTLFKFSLTLKMKKFIPL